MSYENIKRGRQVVGFKFTVKNKPKSKLDPHTADMFITDGLSDKQLGRIARNPSFIADYNHLVSSASPAGQDAAEWEFEMINRLKKDASAFQKRPIREYLEY